MKLIEDSFDFEAFLHQPEQHKVRPAADYLQSTIDLFYVPIDATPVPTMLWEKTRQKIAFRGGEVSLFAGINGHGKSMFMSQVVLDLCKQGQRTMVASFEMQPARQMQRMSRQAYAGSKPTIEFITVLHNWTDGRLWLYDHVGSVDWHKLIAVIRYAVSAFGIRHFVIDSLMKCVPGEDNYNEQKDFVNSLCSVAQNLNVHVYLIHHVRKGETEQKAPGKFDVKGAGAIADQVDNIFIIWRNKQAERGQGRNAGEPTCMLLCEKHRNGDFEGALGFWFDAESQQFLERPDSVPMRYILD